MRKLELDYLKRNCFRLCDSKEGSKSTEYYSEIISDGCQVSAFMDQRQLALIQAQFGDSYKRIENMIVFVKPVNDSELDVSLHWKMKGIDDEMYSSISGEGLYELVSQAIVLAEDYCDF